MSYVVERYGVGVDLSYEHKTKCPRCSREGRDNSGDNLHCYGLDKDGRHKGAFCHACEYVIPSEEWLENNTEEKETEESLVGTEFNEEIHNKLKEITTTDPKGFRGLTKEICTF